MDQLKLTDNQVEGLKLRGWRLLNGEWLRFDDGLLIVCRVGGPEWRRHLKEIEGQAVAA